MPTVWASSSISLVWLGGLVPCVVASLSDLCWGPYGSSGLHFQSPVYEWCLCSLLLSLKAGSLTGHHSRGLECDRDCRPGSFCGYGMNEKGSSLLNSLSMVLIVWVLCLLPFSVFDHHRFLQSPLPISLPISVVQCIFLPCCLFLLYVCGCLPACVYVSHVCARCLWRSEWILWNWSHRRSLAAVCSESSVRTAFSWLLNHLHSSLVYLWAESC